MYATLCTQAQADRPLDRVRYECNRGRCAKAARSGPGDPICTAWTWLVRKDCRPSLSGEKRLVVAEENAKLGAGWAKEGREWTVPFRPSAGVSSRHRRQMADHVRRRGEASCEGLKRCRWHAVDPDRPRMPPAPCSSAELSTLVLPWPTLPLEATQRRASTGIPAAVSHRTRASCHPAAVITRTPPTPSARLDAC
jgi:hypothetical protein